MIDFSDFSSEVFQILRAYGKDIVLYDDTGKRVFEPADARRMYVIGDNILVSIVEDGDNSAVRLFLSPSMNLSQVQGFLETLRRIAVQSNLLFHVKKYNKEIKPKDFATPASVNEQKETSMNIMEGLYGTSKSSYLKLENARMIVRHSARIKEHVIGDRGRHIHSIFVENAQGERHLFPVNMLSGARAMTQHVSNGGNFADEVGSQIVRMAQDFRNLAHVTTHIGHLPGLQEAVNKSDEIEAYGTKGMKSTPWRKIFKNLDALDKWVEKNDASVSAYSKTQKENTHEAALALRVAIMESMKQTKRSFARIYTDATYIGECAKVASNTNLLEGSESLSESVAAIAAILGEGIDDAVLLSVARSVAFESDVSQSLDEEIDEMEVYDMHDDGISVGASVVPKAHPDGEAFKVIAIVDDQQVKVKDDFGNVTTMLITDLRPADIECEESQSISMTVNNGLNDVSKNSKLQEFEQWLEGFDPDAMFGQKVKEDEAHFDQAASIKAADAVEKAIAPYFGQYFKTELQRDGSVRFIQSGGVSSIDHDANNMHVLSPQNLSKAINSLMVEYRHKGWTFTQPVNREFFVGVPAKAMSESASTGSWEVVGTIGLGSPFRKLFDTEEARQDWLDTHENSGKFEIIKLVDPEYAVDNHLDAMAIGEAAGSPQPDYSERYYTKREWLDAAKMFGFEFQGVGFGSCLATDQNGRQVGYYRSTHDSNNGDREMGWFNPPKGEVAEGESSKRNAAESVDQATAPDLKKFYYNLADWYAAGKSFGYACQGTGYGSALAYNADDVKVGFYRGTHDCNNGDREGGRFFAPAMTEGKSFKRNDSDSKSKKDKEQDRKEQRDSKKPVAEAAEPKRYCVTKTKSRDGKTSKHEGTLVELIKVYSNTLDTGASYSGEKGNAKIDRNPKTIASLIKNLNNAVNNSAANGDAGLTFEAEEIAVEKKKVDEGMFDMFKKKDPIKQKYDADKQSANTSSNYPTIEKAVLDAVKKLDKSRQQKFTIIGRKKTIEDMKLTITRLYKIINDPQAMTSLIDSSYGVATNNAPSPVGNESVVEAQSPAQKAAFAKMLASKKNGAPAKDDEKEVAEGKSFKRTEDDDAASVKGKKKDDKENRDSKKTPVSEATEPGSKPGWYLRSKGRICDGPFKTKADATGSKSYPEERAKYWDGSKWGTPVAESAHRDAMDAHHKKARAFLYGIPAVTPQIDVHGDDDRRAAPSTTSVVMSAGEAPMVEDESRGRDFDLGDQDDTDDSYPGDIEEDAVQVGYSFETNIETFDGTVSAKVTYMPNDSGVATILSVVRGDTGEDVLEQMDDEDMLHVENLCDDDMAQQGSEQFTDEDTTIPRDPRGDFLDDVETGGRDGEAQDVSNIARMKALAGLK